jgi:universal stress protein A
MVCFIPEKENFMKAKQNHKGSIVLELGPSENLPSAAVTEPKPAEIQLKTVLVPVDFSTASQKAIDYAVAFGRQFNAELCLLHVIQPYFPGPEMSYGAIESLWSENQKEAGLNLDALKGLLEKHAPVSAQLKTGYPYVEIIRTARLLQADLIVMATHGRTGLAHAFMGSTAEKVVREAGCPVFVVREKEHDFVTPRFNQS